MKTRFKHLAFKHIVNTTITAIQLKNKYTKRELNHESMHLSVIGA